MTSEQTAQEALLQAWLDMSVFIRGNRILSDLSFNEILVCGLLFRREAAGQPPLTATELCERTCLLKSQINHILTGLERQNLICRSRSTTDKRVIEVRLLPEGRSRYLQQHEEVMHLIRTVYHSLGAEDARTLTQLLSRATDIVNQIQRSK